MTRPRFASACRRARKARAELCRRRISTDAGAMTKLIVRRRTLAVRPSRSSAPRSPRRLQWRESGGRTEGRRRPGGPPCGRDYRYVAFFDEAGGFDAFGPFLPPVPPVLELVEIAPGAMVRTHSRSVLSARRP